MKTWVNHSGQIQAKNNDAIIKILYSIYTVWYLATQFLVFFSFLDWTISGHVTQISGFLRYRKIKVTDFFRGCQILEGSDKFSQSYDHYKILCKLASGHALTCLSKTRTNYGKFNTRLQGPKIWNSIDSQIKTFSFNQFKSRLKQQYLSVY